MLNMYDVQGKLVLLKSVSGRINIIEKEDLSTGLYPLQLLDENAIVAIRKVIIAD